MPVAWNAEFECSLQSRGIRHATQLRLVPTPGRSLSLHTTVCLYDDVHCHIYSADTWVRQCVTYYALSLHAICTSLQAHMWTTHVKRHDARMKNVLHCSQISLFPKHWISNTSHKSISNIAVYTVWSILACGTLPSSFADPKRCCWRARSIYINTQRTHYWSSITAMCLLTFVTFAYNSPSMQAGIVTKWRAAVNACVICSDSLKPSAIANQRVWTYWYQENMLYMYAPIPRTMHMSVMSMQKLRLERNCECHHNTGTHAHPSILTHIYATCIHTGTWPLSKEWGAMPTESRAEFYQCTGYYSKPIHHDKTHAMWSKENLSRHLHQDSLLICFNPYYTNTCNM